MSAVPPQTTLHFLLLLLVQMMENPLKTFPPPPFFAKICLANKDLSLMFDRTVPYLPFSVLEFFPVQNKLPQYPLPGTSSFRPIHFPSISPLSVTVFGPILKYLLVALHPFLSWRALHYQPPFPSLFSPKPTLPPTPYIFNWCLILFSAFRTPLLCNSLLPPLPVTLLLPRFVRIFHQL